MVNKILTYWPGSWKIKKSEINLHEAKQLHLNTDNAFRVLNWHPLWNFDTTIKRTVDWYKKFYTEGQKLMIYVQVILITMRKIIKAENLSNNFNYFS